MKPHWDAIVVGGGPGGCLLATTLARCGRRVLLLDKDVLPRYHVGESLSVVTCELLDAVGVGGSMRAAGFVPKAGATFVWGPDPRPWSVYYGGPEGPPPALQVRRDEFDHILVQLAASSGVEVRQGCRVQEALFEDGRAVGVRFLGPDGEGQRAHARWIVDASGQQAFLARQLGLLEPHPQLRHTAVWSYWIGGQRLPGRAAGNSLLVGHREACCWYIPLDDRTDLVSVGAVVRPAGRHLLSGCRDRSYRDALAASEVVPALLADASLVEPVRSAPASAYRCLRLAGPGWMLTGDAACFVDPILSPGVELAAVHGMLAAHTLNTILDAPELEAQALAHYQQRYLRHYQTFTQLCLNLYEQAEASPRARTLEAQAPADDGDHMAFLSLISGLSRAELPPLLGRYMALRKKAERRGGAPVAFGEAEGLDFLAWRFHELELEQRQASRLGEGLGEASIVRLARHVRIGEELFVPADGARTLARRPAVANRRHDRFQLTAELEALFAILDGGCAYREVERRFCETFGIDRDAHRDTFRRWIELLADHALVEWQQAAAREPASPTNSEASWPV